MMQPLFAGQSIETLRHLSRKKVQDKLAAITDINELNDPDTADRLREGGRLDLPVLSRSEATFKMQESGENLDVTVSIPVKSGWYLLNVKPQVQAAVSPRGYVDRPASYLSGGTALLMISQPFARTAKSEDIKDWAARQADLVQKYIEFLRPDIEMHNRDVEKLVEEGLESRRRDLDDLRGLHRRLEGGI